MAIAPTDLTDAAALSFAAYQISESTGSWSVAPSGWTVQRAIDVDVGDATGNAYIAWNATTRTLAIVFRGTDEAGDITEAIQSQAQYYNAFAELTGAVAGLATSLGAEEVMVTGHSLGGTMAEIFISRTATTSLNPMLITFGSPGVSSSGRGPNSVASIVGADSIHLRHTEDPVAHPELSPALPDNWGTLQGNVVEVNRLDIDGSGDTSIFSPEHLPTTYQSSAAAIAEDTVLYAKFAAAPGNYAVAIGPMSASRDGSTGSHDYLIASRGVDAITGEGGNDLIAAREGNDNASGGAGNDTIRAGEGNDSVDGGEGDDALYGDAGYDYVSAGIGADQLFGGTEADALFGNDGNDIVEGGAGSDSQSGGNGNDYVSYRSSPAGVAVNLATGAVSGGDATGDKTLVSIEHAFGSAHADTLLGTSGGNALHGLRGRDVMAGGGGPDRFYCSEASDTGLTEGARDLITDFQRGQDAIDLRSMDASTLQPGNNNFTWRGTGPFATSAVGEVRYEVFDNAGTTNDLTIVWGDIDGDTGAEFAIQLTGLLNLTSADMLL